MGDDIIHILTHITLDYPFLLHGYLSSTKKGGIFWMEHQISAISFLQFNSNNLTFAIRQDMHDVWKYISSMSFYKKNLEKTKRISKELYKKHLSAVEGIKKIHRNVKKRNVICCQLIQWFWEIKITADECLWRPKNLNWTSVLCTENIKNVIH